jgi:HSP20 family molecular chaperone IbpA
MKDLNTQFNSMNKETTRGFDEQKKGVRKSGLSISISTSGNAPPKIKINKIGPEEKQGEIKVKKQKFRGKKLSTGRIEKLSRLPKEEPSTEMKRFSDKITYEINLPGVKSVDDVSIMNLENSIEIKAIAKDKVYTKIIPVNLPIRNYKLAEEKLILELETE